MALNTSAAKKLFVSQSSLSQTVKNLENEYKTKFFETDTSPIKLPFAGEIFVNWATKILKSEVEFKEEIERISNNNGNFIELRSLDITRNICAIYENHKSSFALDQFIQILKNSLDNL